MPYVANAYTTVVLDLYEELALLIEALEKRQIDYAICGGIAMAVWDVPRATVDIDLLVEETDLEAVKAVAASRGYVHEALPMRFADGAIDIRRVSKTDSASGDVLMLDILLVTPQIRDVWDGRQRLEWERGTITVVSRRGLAKLKSFRGSGRDLDDIDRLRGES
jgi:hypothetical protein